MEFVATDKCLRCFCIARSWLQMTPADLAANKSPAVQEQIQEAGTNWDKIQAGEELNFPSAVGVHSTKRTGMRVESWYWALTPRQFRERYKWDTSKTGMALIPVEDDFTRKKIPCYLIQPGLADKGVVVSHRKVIFFRYLLVCRRDLDGTQGQVASQATHRHLQLHE